MARTSGGSYSGGGSSAGNLTVNSYQAYDHRDDDPYEFILTSRAFNDATVTPNMGGIFTRGVVGGVNEGWTGIAGQGYGWAGLQSAAGVLNATSLGQFKAHVNLLLYGVAPGNGSPGGLKAVIEPGFNNAPAYLLALMASTYKDQNGNAWPGKAGQSVGNMFDSVYRAGKTAYIQLLVAYMLSAFDAPQQRDMWLFLGGEFYGENRLPGYGDLAVPDNTAASINLGVDTSITTTSALNAAFTGGHAAGFVVIDHQHVAAYAGANGSTLPNLVWITNSSGTVANKSITYVSDWCWGADCQFGTGLAPGLVSLQSIGLDGYLVGAGFVPGTAHNLAGPGFTGWSGANDLAYWQWRMGMLARNMCLDLWTARQANWIGPLYVKHNGSAMLQYSPTQSQNLMSYTGVGPGSQCSPTLTNGPYGGNDYWTFLQSALEGIDHHFMIGCYGRWSGQAPWAATVQAVTGATAVAYPFGAVRQDFSGMEIRNPNATIGQAGWGRQMGDLHEASSRCIGEPATASAATWWSFLGPGGCATVTKGIFPVGITVGSTSWYDLLAIAPLQRAAQFG